MIIKLTLLLFSFAYPMIPLVEKLPPNNSYYPYYLKRFHHYYTNEIYDFQNHKVVGRELDSISHWHTDGVRNFLWGIGVNKNEELIYGLRYPNPTKEASFLEVSSDKKSPCLLHKVLLTCGNVSFTREMKDKFQGGEGFPLHPRGHFIFKEFVKSVVIYRDQNKNVVRLDYFLKDVQAEWLPHKLKKIVYQIGYDTRLPLDKISVTKSGEIYVLYP